MQIIIIKIMLKVTLDITRSNFISYFIHITSEPETKSSSHDDWWVKLSTKCYSFGI